MKLQESGIHVIEIAPPRASMEMDGPGDSDSVDGDEFVAEVMASLSAQPPVTEVVVDAARALRYAERDGHYGRVLAAVNSHVRVEDVL